MTGRRPGIWWTGKAILYHCILAVVVPGFSALFWWQVQRVRAGNTLSWAYVFEWPFFLGYAVYLWWKLVHDTDELSPAGQVAPAPRADASARSGPGHAPAGTPPAEDAPQPPPVSPPSPQDEELAAYNRYLAELHTTGRPKRW